jgi:hypothetical protein
MGITLVLGSTRFCYRTISSPYFIGADSCEQRKPLGRDVLDVPVALAGCASDNAPSVAGTNDRPGTSQHVRAPDYLDQANLVELHLPLTDAELAAHWLTIKAGTRDAFLARELRGHIQYTRSLSRQQRTI